MIFLHLSFFMIAINVSCRLHNVSSFMIDISAYYRYFHDDCTILQLGITMSLGSCRLQHVRSFQIEHVLYHHMTNYLLYSFIFLSYCAGISTQHLCSITRLYINMHERCLPFLEIIIDQLGEDIYCEHSDNYLTVNIVDYPPLHMITNLTQSIREKRYE